MKNLVLFDWNWHNWSICERMLSDQLHKKYKMKTTKRVTEGWIYATMFQNKISSKKLRAQNLEERY